jgi:1-carboxybiuret hydrolase subunit AtzG-like protein
MPEDLRACGNLGPDSSPEICMSRKAIGRKAKSARRTGTSARSPRTRKADAVETLIIAAGEALALPIEASWRAGVTFNLQLLLKHAALIGEFPLADEAEPAPVFRA